MAAEGAQVKQQVAAAPQAANQVVPAQEPLQDGFLEALQYLPVQRSLTVGAADDPLEEEADRMADTVMRMPEQALVQRKCAACEEEEVQRKTLPAFIQRSCAACQEEEVQRKPLAATVTPFIQAKGSSGSMAGNAVSQQIQNTRGGGSSMDRPTQSFMESRFGADFSNVKIHTGDYAVQLSRELNAQAFTVGSDIYFNEGKYNPGAASGKHLLAHELTHTVQQGAAGTAVQRTPAPGDFTVDGIEASAGTEPNFVFFDRALPDNTAAPETQIDPAERTKIVNYAAANPGGIHLNGFASEEGEAAGNGSLIGLRLQAVTNVLNAAPVNYAGTVTTASQQALSRNQYEYRRWRAVEMLPPGQPSSRITPAGRGNVPCTPAQINNTVIPARDAAIARLNAVKARVDAYISNTAANTAVRDALLYSFHSSSIHTARTVSQQLQANATFLSGMLGILSCGTADSLDCGETAEALTNPQTITLCQVFFDPGNDLDHLVTVLVHESAHGSRAELNDRAYRNERVMPLLSTRQALDNAESYAVFMEHLQSGAAPAVGPAQQDTAAGCGADEAMARAAVSWAERWNTYAVMGLQQIYGDDGNMEFIRPHVAGFFGRADRAVLAGILDRYLRMMEFFSAGTVHIECVDRTDPLYNTWKVAQWNGRTVRISNLQLRASHLNADDRVKYIYGALAVDNFGAPEQHRMAYPNVARAIKLFFWDTWG